MTDNELLLAISTMMDQKFKSELQPIKNDLHDWKEDVKILKTDVRDLKNNVEILKTEVKSLRTDVDILKTEVKDLRTDIENLKTEVKDLRSDIENLKTEVKGLKSDVDILKTEVKGLGTDVDTLKDKVESLTVRNLRIQSSVHRLELSQENIVLPRLNTIEACYTDTYNRYKNSADRMDAYFEDTELLKRVVSEHSEKIQKMA